MTKARMGSKSEFRKFRLARKFKAIRAAAGREALIIDDFSSAELNLAFGGSNVIHAAVAAGGLERRVVASCLRLRRYRVPSDSEGSAVAGSHLPEPLDPAAGCQAAGSEPGSEQSSAAMSARQPGASENGPVNTISDQAGTEHA